jgi:hypothetical protein
MLMAGSVLLGSAIGPGVSAAWTSSTTSATGTFTFATSSAAFTAGTNDASITGGSAGSSYVVSVGALAVAANTYTTLTNTSTVSATLAGALSASAIGVTARVDQCSVAWAAGACSGSTTALLALTALGTPSVTYGTALASNAVVYLRYRFTSTAITATTVTAAVTVTPTTTGTNRTAG